MRESDITLTNSSVGGDLIGGDKNLYSFHNDSRSTYLQNLYDKFQLEKEQNQELVEFCEELNYLNSILNEDIIGLEAKLKAGKREKLIHYATYVKEKFHKKLMRTSQYSLVAQDVNVYLLTKVHRGFMMEIYSLICNDEPEDKINIFITERIINPVKVDLGINLFKYDEDDIMGMIFFLTGNCHIKWC